MRTMLSDAAHHLRRCEEKAEHRNIHNAEFERAGEYGREIRAALAQPADDGALRELLLAVAVMTHEHESDDTPLPDIVEAVLVGER
jgi:hypothetical protein